HVSVLPLSTLLWMVVLCTVIQSSVPEVKVIAPLRVHKARHPVNPLITLDV
ncbi:unnamed protein product, partial [Staurois parvus]